MVRKTERSNAELFIEFSMKKFQQIISSTKITIRDAEELLSGMGRILMKCEELRKSRDNWREKYEKEKIKT